MKLTKEEFVKAVSEYKKAEDLINAFADNYCKCGETQFDDILNSYFDLIVTLCEFEEENVYYGNALTYFINELWWGEKYKPGVITDKDGNEIKLSTLEECYDLIVKETKAVNED